ncbi:aminotransferase class I/II-fold pyridoxal phosphate-dependent enzyme [Sporolactobacillus pectinivorans]|uniref:aminotransferase class I/II-fold pyridoxal phosphate-dependent enzyme n=1 Tax=Sporolactobacillus pectinivorans TaxID=1591408 RepID=UPI000C26991B|nr:aminotransferase class I/II-fold pyridoxal phosphate-dependent enzyme [Sporolactobacillus pectinivorans]
MNPVAKSINDGIYQENPYVYEMMSSYGKHIYFSKEGNVKQIADAAEKSEKFNATSGFATDHGEPIYLNVIHDTLPFYDPKDIFFYVSTLGIPELRKAWAKKMLEDNPSLRGKKFVNPIGTIGLTNGLSIIADLFVDEGDIYILPDKKWENYRMIFGVSKKGKIVTFPMFDENNHFNCLAFKQAIFSQKSKGKVIIILNFPNNPTGYTPTEQESQDIVAAIRDSAEAGINVIAITDDAYFGLFYGDSIEESLFGRLANLHPRVLAIKVDGATKEEYAWGFRVGFLTFGVNSEKMEDLLEQKVMGVIRTTISNGPHPSQTFVLHALQSPELKAQKEENFEIMKRRAVKIRELMNSGKYDDAWGCYPFNSGYFICLKVKSVNADQLRMHLLNEYGVGTIALSDTDLRIAFSRIDEENLEDLFNNIYKGAKDLQLQPK